MISSFMNIQCISRPEKRLNILMFDYLVAGLTYIDRPSYKKTYLDLCCLDMCIFRDGLDLNVFPHSLQSKDNPSR